MQTTEHHDKADLAHCAGKHLTFHLADEVYGVPILKVQEIIGIKELTKVPKVPPYIKGVLNLRGKVIPVVDLRVKFGMPEQEDSRSTSIIIFQIEKAGNDVVVGVRVDGVKEVVDIKAEEIEPTPSIGMQEAESFVLGMAKLNNIVHMLLDMDTILDSEAIVTMAQDAA
ncbi:MAG: chemotaxis protein CheW [Thermodesulfobacteriota bacterium]